MRRILSLTLAIIIILAMSVTAGAADTYTVNAPQHITLQINGKTVTADTLVTSSDRIRFVVNDESIVCVEAGGLYYDVNKTFYLTSDANFTDAVPLRLGLEMINGAQIRVGNMPVTEDGRIDPTAGSGLRFIATVDYNDTIVAEPGIVFGIKIVAEENPNPLYIRADSFQNDEKTMFSAAVTNLAVSNYNRNFTACGYATVTLFDGSVKEVNSESVVRSVYQVSTGIMKNSSAEGDENFPYQINEEVKKVLNAYINQTGIRLNYYSDGRVDARVEGKGSYTGDLYFDVEYNLNDTGATEVIITPLDGGGGFGNPITLASWWTEYVRINNNHSTVVNYISDVSIENNTLRFTFDILEKPEYEFNQEDSVTIVTDITNEYITGIRGGEEVSYPLHKHVYLMGLAKEFEDIVPGSVVMIAENEGVCVAIELLASLGMPINPDDFEADFGVYDAADNSTKYKNVVTEIFAKSGTKLVCMNLPDETKTTYRFEKSSSPCYRIGIAMDGNTPVISVTSKTIGTYPTIFEDTSKYHNYLYLRYNSETERVKECVFYCVPKDVDFTGDGEYSDIFSLENYRIIIE